MSSPMAFLRSEWFRRRRLISRLNGRKHLKQTRNGIRTRKETNLNKAKKAPKKAAKKTTNGIQILRKRFVKNDAEMARMVREEKANMAVAQKICDLRNEAGVSQRELAKLVGTSASVICRLEDADYDGHSLSMLHRIAAALDRRIDIQFVPLKEARQYA
jgi:DNA-binding XRE family transcriptional regulator